MKYYISKHQEGSKLTPAQKKYWYKNRYTPDEIKEMQLKLNKTGLYNIDITGEPTDEFLNAVLSYQTMFQKSTGANMRLDGLIGDETAAAMGLKLSSANRGYTVHGRSGQGRTAQPSAQDQKIIDWANSEEVARFMSNPSQDKATQKEYIKKYYKYLSPENKRRVYNYWDGYHDELGITDPGKPDEELNAHLKNVGEISKLYQNQQRGIGNLSDMIASGAIRTGEHFNEDLEKYIAQHKLSPEQVRNIMNSDEYHTASQVGMYNAEAGRANSEAKKSEEMEEHVRQGRDAFAKELVNQAVNVPYLPYSVVSAMVSGNPEDMVNNSGKSFSQIFGAEAKPLTNEDGSINLNGVKTAAGNFALDVVTNPFTIGNAVQNLPKLGQNFLTQGRNLRVYTPGSQLPHGTYKMGNNVFKPTNFHYDGKVPVNGRLVQPRTPNGKFTPLTATGKNSPNSGLGVTGTLGDEVAYRAKVAATTKTPMNQWQLGNTPMSQINSGKELPFETLTSDMLGLGVGNATASTALNHMPNLYQQNNQSTGFVSYKPEDVAYSPNPYLPHQRTFVNEKEVIRPTTAKAGTTNNIDEYAAEIIAEINSLKAKNPNDPAIASYEAMLKSMQPTSQKKGGCLYKNGKRIKK